MNYRKAAGWSVIALGAVSFLVALKSSTFDCNTLILIWAGFSVLRGGRIGRIVALVMCGLIFLGGVAVLVSSLVHGREDVGLWSATVAPAIGTWALINMALLAQLRQPAAGVAEGDGKSAAAASESPLRPFQYFLRSLFVLTFLVAIACWLGTRPLPPNDSWGGSWSYGTNRGVGQWSLQVIGYRSGTPVVGYLWRAEGIHGASSPTRFEIRSDGRDKKTLLLDGKPVKPAEDFQLFVNDIQDNPMCLRLSKQNAREIFGKNYNLSRIEKFWKDVVEPKRGKH